MKIKKIFLTLSVMLLFFSALLAQDKATKTIKFKVYGVCGMCKMRIENALDTKGVKFASWDPSTHICEVTYKEGKITEEEIHKLLNEVGHDTDKSKASDEQYNTVHECCRYREHEDHE